ncbi:hypothetical protein ES708_06134 [subsurface metagenome]
MEKYRRTATENTHNNSREFCRRQENNEGAVPEHKRGRTFYTKNKTQQPKVVTGVTVKHHIASPLQSGPSDRHQASMVIV